ncbi:hypothetical protein EDD85DRAFT_946172 [Armillaria nabsnona]|nr:hypothetical protein EDD85DRAFT_946172 [Armillaria nabsnona]
MVRKAHPEPLGLDTGIPPEQFKSLLVADHYILLHQACNCHPAIVDMNTLATYLQPEIKSILDSIHPFLVAHKSYFPKDSDPIVIRFLVMATVLANNLSPAFQSSQWDAWKIEDSTRMFKLLGVHPFLVAHVERFPDDEDPLVLRFLMTVTAVANNLGPCFFDPDWTVWLEQDCHCLVISFQNFKTLFPGDLHFPGSQHLVTQLDSLPGSKATPFTSDLPFFQVGLSCYPWDLEKLPSVIADALRLLSRAGVYPIHLPAQLFSSFYLWPEVDLPAT